MDSSPKNDEISSIYLKYSLAFILHILANPVTKFAQAIWHRTSMDPVHSAES